MKFGVYVEVVECAVWCAVWPNPRLRSSQDHETFKVRNSSIFEVYLLRRLQVSWQVTTDS